jgi:hypothetical protein
MMVMSITNSLKPIKGERVNWILKGPNVLSEGEIDNGRSGRAVLLRSHPHDQSVHDNGPIMGALVGAQGQLSSHSVRTDES